MTALKGVTTRGHRWQQEQRGVRAANVQLAHHGLCYAAGINEAAQPMGLIDAWRDAQLGTSPDSGLRSPQPALPHTPSLVASFQLKSHWDSP